VTANAPPLLFSRQDSRTSAAVRYLIVSSGHQMGLTLARPKDPRRRWVAHFADTRKPVMGVSEGGMGGSACGKLRWYRTWVMFTPRVIPPMKVLMSEAIVERTPM
jgi:hypothetical protein